MLLPAPALWLLCPELGPKGLLALKLLGTLFIHVGLLPPTLNGLDGLEFGDCDKGATPKGGLPPGTWFGPDVIEGNAEGEDSEGLGLPLADRQGFGWLPCLGTPCDPLRSDEKVVRAS